MKFPTIGEIATTSVVSIDVKSSITDAIDMMLEHNHRNIIVIDEGEFRILTIVDVLNIQTKKIDLSTQLKDLKLPAVPAIYKHKNVLDTLEYLSDNVDYLCVINDDDSLYGFITHTDITSNIDPDTLMNNFRLQDFLKLGKRMKWVSKDEKTSDLINEMVHNSYDNVIIVEDSKPVGIFTTKDVMKLIKNNKELDLPISKYMSTPVDTITRGASVKEALSFVNEKHYKRAVVVDEDGNLSGIIAQKELISLTYSGWAEIMKEYHEELNEINAKLENKNKEYETRASTDALTGLYNRFKFSELYNSSYTSMVQRHNDMSLIILDIDHFKNVNDTYGHNVGDNVLIQVSQTLLKTLRNIDIVCRWGGEEFIILLPTANLGQATLLAEKLRTYIEKLEIDVVKKITSSFGVSQVYEGDDMKTVINRADKALYLAKNSGRNCVKTEKDL
ncbi:diguanylate cyclase [Sulfurimonas sp.]|uniref:diguanylate cyclase n=1 Tax=Sulfurimonas sp. TaxID=2022749 RepID=UPI0026329474|nr:diguanylate cyclase [Sulfurimonas sp.]MCW8895882.1 diguanylate cyclase [Sulfurimonas sp.]MCW9067566.1 diguanylate cyclase [Sulfurimonas sp.]